MKTAPVRGGRGYPWFAPMGRVFTITLLALIGLWQAAEAQRVIFLPLEREGAASVVLDELSGTAYVLDGGQKGSLVKRPVINGRPLLNYLWAEGYRNVYIACSHPHEDHLAGLLEVIRYRSRGSADVDLTKFDSVVFVDSDYPSNVSLFGEFTKVHGKRKNVSHESATNRNAYAAARARSRKPAAVGVSIDNYVFKPENGGGPHGHSVINQYVLGPVNDKNRATFIDFDDAADDLIARWAQEEAGKLPPLLPRYFVAPHHNSDLTNAAPLMALEPEGVIFQVNPRNKFLHPGLENWLKWIDTVGIDRVYITGAGEPIEAGPGGLEPLNKQQIRDVYEHILRPLVELAEKERVGIDESWSSPWKVELGNLRRERRRSGMTQVALADALNVDLAVIRDWERGVTPIPAELTGALELELHRGYLRRQRQRLQTRVGHLWRLEEQYRKAGAFSERTLVAWFRSWGPGPWSGGSTRRSPSEPSAPGRRPPDEDAFRTNTDSFGGPAGGGGGPRPRPSGPAGGTGAYPQLSSQFRNEFQSFQSSSPQPSSGGPGSSGRSRVGRFRFSRSFSRGGIPIFGGIVIGNEVSLSSGFALKRAAIRRLPGSDEPAYEILLLLLGPGGQEWATYQDFTPAELWAAYHTVNPPAVWHEQYGVDRQDCNLVGMVGRDSLTWSFGIHPAIANTLLAHDAMNLDMLLSVLQGSRGGVSRETRDSLGKLGQWASYQWYDAPSILTVGNGAVVVKAKSYPHDILLRLRLTRKPLDGDRMVKSSEIGGAGTTKLVANLYDEIDYLRRFDRFGKLLAILNFVADSQNVAFPSLPQEISPGWIAVEPKLSVKAAMRRIGIAPDLTAVWIGLGVLVAAISWVLVRWWDRRALKSLLLHPQRAIAEQMSSGDSWWVPLTAYLLVSLSIVGFGAFVSFSIVGFGALVAALVVGWLVWALVYGGTLHLGTRLVRGRKGVKNTIRAVGYGLFWPGMVGAMTAAVATLMYQSVWVSERLHFVPPFLRLGLGLWALYVTIAAVRSWHQFTWMRATAGWVCGMLVLIIPLVLITFMAAWFTLQG
jgi:hypothetical protein